jgi:DNA polymerase
MQNNKRKAMASLIEKWSHCDRCNIGKLCKHHVFYRGEIHSELAIIGEAPGLTEDEFGEPFVGRAGKLLDDVLREAGLDIQSDVFLTNSICCLPKDEGEHSTRQPKDYELTNCFPRLQKTMEIVQPLLIIALGNVAQETCKRLVKLHCEIWEAKHPSYILRNGSSKSPEYQKLVDLFVQAKEFCYD